MTIITIAVTTLFTFKQELSVQGRPDPEYLLTEQFFEQTILVENHSCHYYHFPEMVIGNIETLKGHNMLKKIFFAISLSIVFALLGCGNNSKLSGKWDASYNMSIGDVTINSNGTFVGDQWPRENGTYVYNDGTLIFTAQVKGVTGRSYTEEWVYTDVKFVSDDKIVAINKYQRPVTMTRL